MSLCLPDVAQLTSFQMGFFERYLSMGYLFAQDIFPRFHKCFMCGNRGVWWLEEEEGRGFGAAAVARVALGKWVKKEKRIFSYFRNFQIALRGNETPTEGLGKVRLVRLDWCFRCRWI